MKKILYLAIALVLALSLAACGSDKEPADEPPASENELISVGIINNPPSESGYRTANDKDFKDVFTEENGYEAAFAYSDKIEEQLTSFNQFVNEGVDYILLSAASTDGWDDAIAAADEAGIKVILFDRMIAADGYVAAVVSDMAKEGDTAVNWLLEQGLDTVQVVHIQGVMGSDAQKGRSGALDAAAADKKLEIVGQQTGNWSADEAKAFVESIINAKKAFNVIYAENDDMAKGAVAALDAAGITHGVDGDVIVMGFDCNKWALRELLAGTWNYDGQCSPFQAGVINDIVKNLENGTEPAEKIIINEEQGFDAKVITQDDVDTFGLGE
jgi:simple sugar transport system substrate-binding protein